MLKKCLLRYGLSNTMRLIKILPLTVSKSYCYISITTCQKNKKMIEKLYNYYFEQKEPQKSCMLALRNIILKRDENISETVKYGMPCFCYKKKIFCYLWTDSKTNEPYILFVEGKFLDNPQLEQGNRSRMKILRIDPIEDLPIKLIESLLDKTLDIYRTGTISIK